MMRNLKEDDRKTGTLTNSPKILLALLPYWDPLIPPNGIATLKSYLVKKGFNVKTNDVVVKNEFQEIYEKYFNLLRQNIDDSQQGNLYNMGHDLLTDHLTAHIHYQDERRYIELVKQIVFLVFYTKFNDDLIKEMIQLLDELFTRLKAYFIRLLEEKKPDVLGLTCYRGTLPASMFVFKLTKEMFPHIMTVMGGSMFSDSHAVGSPNYESVVETTKPYVDKIIIGQGEILFEKLLKGELPQSKRVYTLEDIDNRSLEFHEMDVPDYREFDIDLYPFIPLVTSSSCPYGCTFCNSRSYWGKYRKKDPGQVVREMQELYKRHKNQLFHIVDSLVNPVIPGLARELIKSGTSLYYDCYLRVGEDVANIENTMKWRRSGLYRVRLGVESGSQRVLDLMHKNITPSLSKASVSALAYAGVKTTLYWVVGHPGETEEDFRMTLQLLEELKDDIWQSEAAPILFHYSGQANTGHWEGKLRPLYPDSVKDIMVSRPWTLDCNPSREERNHRMFRFHTRCRELGIPNPYSLQENYLADQRWKKLHKNAVPALHEFINKKKFISENKQIRLIASAKDTRAVLDDGDFTF
jgi:hypothetical protein